MIARLNILHAFFHLPTGIEYKCKIYDNFQMGGNTFGILHASSDRAAYYKNKERDGQEGREREREREEVGNEKLDAVVTDFLE